MTSAIMYDDVSADSYPPDTQLAAAYIDGRYDDFAAVAARFPTIPHVSITIWNGDADVLDCEQGDATPDMVGPWVARQKGRGKVAVVYVNLSNWSAARASCIAVGVLPDGWWVAHYDNDPTIPYEWIQMGCVAKQFMTTAAWDRSIVLDTWPNLITTAQPPHEDLDMPRAITCTDPITGGTWEVLCDDGEVDTDEGAPYLGGLNNHPEWNSMDVSHPVVAIEPWKGDGTNGGGNGYKIGEYDPNPPAGKGRVRWYRFPRDARYAVTK